MNRLFVQRITSIGAVEEGDNPGAHIMLFKRRTQKENLTNRGEQVSSAWRALNPYTDHGPSSFVKAVHNDFVIIEEGDKSYRVPYTTEDTGVVFGGREQIKVVETIEVVKGTDSASNKGQHEMDLTKFGLNDKDREAIEKEFEKLRNPPPPVDILKRLDGDVKAEFEKRDAKIAEMEKAAAETSEALAKERDTRLTAEFVKTATNYEVILGAADEAGPMLKALATDGDAFEWLTKKLDAISVIVETSDVFKELGVAGEGDPASQIVALAKDKMKDSPKLTLAQARMLVRKERPDLRDLEREAK